MNDGDLVLYGVGDIGPDRPDPASIFDEVADLLNRGDIVFGQLESNLSTRGALLPQCRLPCRAKPETALALKEAGFEVISIAGNHCMDFGQEGLFDTIDVLRNQGLKVVGAGANIDEARRPVILEVKGTRVAFLAYSSILPQAYWATTRRSGVAPLRAFTFYEQVEHDQPGTPPKIHTFPNRDDLTAMVDDIASAKAQADVVILSVHWGIHFVPETLADYQRDIARAAIDAGADLILGGHAHILKGIEVYKGKAIFYSLSNFAMELHTTPEEIAGSAELFRLNPDWVPDPEYPSYFFPPDSRKALIVKCLISEKAVKAVTFHPVYIDKQARPVVLDAADPRFQEVVSYLERISKNQGLDTCFVTKGDEVFVNGAP